MITYLLLLFSLTLSQIYAENDPHSQITTRIYGRRLDGPWGGYRLCDVVKGYIGGGNYPKKWPLSIATEYIHLTHNTNQYHILCDIVQRRGHNHSIPRPNDAVVHLRLGDVLQGQDAQISWEQGDQGEWKYVKNRSYYEHAIAALPPHVRNVTIVSWVHHESSDYTISVQYRNIVSKFFQNNGYHVSLRRGHIPDDDFIFMAHAQHFIYGGGGYSRLIGECVHRYGGITPISWEGKGNGEGY
jgi:hypothetical protein